MAAPMRLRRSVLFLPASNPRAIEKARVLPADGLICNLERRRRSGGQGRGAGRLGGVPLFGGGFALCELIVRVNPLERACSKSRLANRSALPGLASSLP